MMNLLEKAIEAALAAGHEIMQVYQSDVFDVEFKGDNSPLTRADRMAHDTIVSMLESSGIPILSEEGKDIPFAERKDWNEFWLIDPLDGTKEFIKRNGEFTVNIALINSGVPVLGVIFVPVSKELYFAQDGLGSRKILIKDESIITTILADAHTLPMENPDRIFTAVVSRSHMSPATEDYINKIQDTRYKTQDTRLKTQEEEDGDIEFITRGSSLKICMVAEGKADVYPRFGPTMEWDTGAGHAIAKYAGKRFYRTDNGKELTYNKESLLNPYFIVD